MRSNTGDICLFEPNLIRAVLGCGPERTRAYPRELYGCPRFSPGLAAVDDKSYLPWVSCSLLDAVLRSLRLTQEVEMLCV